MSGHVDVVGTAQGHINEIEGQSEQSVRDVMCTRVFTGECGDELSIRAAYGKHKISDCSLVLGKMNGRRTSIVHGVYTRGREYRHLSRC